MFEWALNKLLYNLHWKILLERQSNLSIKNIALANTTAYGWTSYLKANMFMNRSISLTIKISVSFKMFILNSVWFVDEIRLMQHAKSKLNCV